MENVMSIKVGDALDIGIGPQFLEVVALSLLGKENMCKNRAIINYNPL